jgi:hypothetical protein
VRRSVIMFAGAGVAAGVMSEILVSTITEASESLGLSPFFVGVIAVVGNAAEHWGWGLLRQARQDRTGRYIVSDLQPRSPCSWHPSSCSPRSSSVRSQWHWSPTGSSSARSSSRSSLQTRSPNAESPRGTKVYNRSPSMRWWG